MLYNDSMNTIVTNLFSCPILRYSTNIDNEKLIKYFYLIKKKQKGRVISNVGGYQSEDLDLEDKNLQPLITNILQSSISYVTLCAFKKNINYNIHNMWLNINYFKDYNIPHLHPQCLFSGVYYLKVPKNSGGILFQHPSQKYLDYDWQKFLIDNFNTINSSTWRFYPEEGTIYIFPSWLIHSVEQNLNKKKERISIAFNIGVKNNNE